MNWLRYSGIWLTLVLNPFHWQLRWFERDEQLPGTTEYSSQFLMLSIRIVVDNGDW